MDFARQNSLYAFMQETVLTALSWLATLQPIGRQPPALGKQRDIGRNLESNLAYQSIATSCFPCAARTCAQLVTSYMHRISVFKGFHRRIQRIAHVRMHP